MHSFPALLLHQRITYCQLARKAQSLEFHSTIVLFPIDFLHLSEGSSAD